MPHQAGFLQTIKSEEIQKLTSNSYSKQRRLSKSLKADVDLWMKYSCKHQGEYYITAFIPKANVHYLSVKHPEKMTVGYIRRFCGKSEKVFIVTASVHYTFKADKNRKLTDAYGNKWNIMCGDVSINAKSYNSKVALNNTFDNFKAIILYESGITYGVRRSKDISLDMWLELTKHF